MKNNKTPLQVSSSHYENIAYNTKGRFASYWHQINEVLSVHPKSVFEIGLGNGFFHDFIVKNTDFDIDSLDIDSNLKPTYVGSVLDIPIINKAYDCSVCFQVLEHIPYENFEEALLNLKSLSKSFIIISLPDQTRFVGLHINKKLFPIKKAQLSFSIPFVFPTQHFFDGQHYWEIGMKNYPLKKIKQSFVNTGLKLIKTYRVFEYPVHRFFILAKP